MRRPLQIIRPWEPYAIRFIGDPHLESPDHARSRFIRDLEEGCEQGDTLWFLGDIHSWILPNDLKRSNASHRNSRVNAHDTVVYDDIIGESVERTAELLKPYVNNIEVVMVGNHETSVIKYHNTDPVRMLIKELNQHKTKGVFENKRIQHGGYTVWLQLKFRDEVKHAVQQIGWIHHGAGGSAVVTRGIIDAARIKAARTFDFAIIGHKHTEVTDRDRIEYMDDHGNVRRSDRDFAIVGGYSGGSDEPSTYDPMEGGYRLDWSSESFYNNESQGCLRMEFIPVYDKPNNYVRRTMTVL